MWSFPGGTVVKKKSACQCRRYGLNPWDGKIPWRRKWQLTPGFLPCLGNPMDRLQSRSRKSLTWLSKWKPPVHVTRHFPLWTKLSIFLFVRTKSYKRPKYLPILKTYKQFLILNEGFVNCSKVSQIVLPENLKKLNKENLTFLNEKIQQSIVNKDITELFKYYDLIL